MCFCFPDGRTGVRTPHVKIMTTYLAGGLVGQLATLWRTARISTYVRRYVGLAETLVKKKMFNFFNAKPTFTTDYSIFSGPPLDSFENGSFSSVHMFESAYDFASKIDSSPWKTRRTDVWQSPGFNEVLLNQLIWQNNGFLDEKSPRNLIIRLLQTNRLSPLKNLTYFEGILLPRGLY